MFYNYDYQKYNNITQFEINLACYFENEIKIIKKGIIFIMMPNNTLYNLDYNSNTQFSAPAYSFHS